MTNSNSTEVKAATDNVPRSEEATATIVAAVLGLCAFSVSFSHVQSVAVDSGQGGWVADAIAASVELMATAAITEIRRRRRRCQPTGWPRGVLVLGVAMSLASNLATAQPTIWGCVMAAWSQVAFLAVAALIETRAPVVRPESEPVRPEPEPVRPEPVRPEPEPVRPEPVRPEPVRPEPEPVRPEPVRPKPEPVRSEPEPVRSEPVRRRGAPDSSAARQQLRAAGDGRRDMGDGPEERAAASKAGIAGRPSRTDVVRKLRAEITADEGWTPDYEELTRTSGYSLSWCEKRVAEARRAVQDARTQPFAEAIRTEPPTAVQQPDEEHHDYEALASVTEFPNAPKRPTRNASTAPDPSNGRQKAQA